MKRILRIPQSIWSQLLTEITTHLPEEACGLLAGTYDQVAEILPIENILHSSNRYRMDPRQQLAAFQHIDKVGFELLAIYHSHPDGPAAPSATDIAEAYYPEAVYLIIARVKDIFSPRGYLIQSGQVNEIIIEILE
jgi:[CysO sulfur-carrier protein]-S-L-cysteine hydrolase